MRKRCDGCPDSTDDKDNNGGQITVQHGAAGHIVRPTHKRDAEADYERQSEIHAKGRGARVLALTFALLRLTFLADSICGRLWRKAVEFSLDLP